MSDATWSKRPVWIVAGLLAVALGAAGYNLWRIEVVFESVPEGAVVRVDGRGIGLTPLIVSMEPGKHRIELTHSHFATHEETLNLARGDRLHKQVQMQSGLGRLALLSNPRGAWVEVNGRRLEGTTPLEVEEVTGPTTIRMGLTERRVAEREVIVLADQLIEVTIELNMDPHGSVTVTTSPRDASVSLPELDLDYRPGVRVPIGEQLIRISRSGYEPQQIRYDVNYGDNITHVELTRALASIRVSTKPADARVSLSYTTGPDRRMTVDYQQGMRLPIGRVEISARSVGYRTAFEAVELTPAGRRVSLTLELMDVHAGETFSDKLASGGKGPLMVVIPGGEFVMGDPAGPPSVQPATRRSLTEPFALSVHEVSVLEFLAFAGATGHKVDKRLIESTETAEPARYLAWSEAVAYADWLTEETGSKYRLPTEAEWEYAARAGSSTAYYFGDDSSELCQHANLADQSTKKIYRQWSVHDCDDGFAKLAPVGSFAANDFGLHDIHGNVSEWVLECGIPPYSEAVLDGTEVNSGQSCRTHGIRGGSWDSQAAALQVTRRGFGDGRNDDRGIRLLREL